MTSEEGRADEWFARQILLGSRLLADSINWAYGEPMPKTVCVAFCQSGQPLQSAAARRAAISDRRSGGYGAADGPGARCAWDLAFTIRASQACDVGI